MPDSVLPITFPMSSAILPPSSFVRIFSNCSKVSWDHASTSKSEKVSNGSEIDCKS